MTQKTLSTLAIETSCDDTSLAVVRYENGHFFVDQLQAYSQIADHQAYGGVVPEIAFRLHSEQILALLQHFLEDIRNHVDMISVTTHPWLAGSLLVGKTVAHMVGHKYNKPVLGINHIHGHLFSLLLERSIDELAFPRVVLTASGGHNEIYVVEKVSDWHTDYIADNQTIISTKIFSDLVITKLGKTLDDAAGECFDKVARMLGGPYPWWARVDKHALLWKPNPQYRFKRIMLEEHENMYDFSFSGMKSQVYNLLQRCEKEWITVAGQLLYDILYEFQEAVSDVLTFKLIQAVKQYNAATIWIVWWVSASDRLFEKASEAVYSLCQKPVLRPVKKVYSTDNWAMIGAVWLLLGE